MIRNGPETELCLKVEHPDKLKYFTYNCISDKLSELETDQRLDKSKSKFYKGLYLR